MGSTQQKILEFLRTQDLAVISTVHADKKGTESAVVSFCNTEALELVFGTSNNSRKYKNISASPEVSFVIGWSSITGSLQFEGIAQEIPIPEREKYISMLEERKPGHKEFAQNPDQVYFLVRPVWICLNDNTFDSPVVYEINR